MTVRIGINGFGRIGRNYLRAARSLGADVDVVAINDLTSAETLAHLLRYDSTHGRFDGEVGVSDSSLVLDSGPIEVLAERDPKALPWDRLAALIDFELNRPKEFSPSADTEKCCEVSIPKIGGK